MGTIAEFDVPASEFAFAETFERLSGVAAEVERVVAYDPDHVMPYVWFTGAEDELRRLDEALEADSSVERVEPLAEHEDERLYRMHWVDGVELIIHAITEEEATILDAEGTADIWRFTALFPDRDALSRTYDYCTERGLTIDVRRIHDLEEDPWGRFGLTEAQHETLVAALEDGYYEIPRRTDMDGLAEELGISHQALSERLRRAHGALVKDAIEIAPGADEDER